MPEATTINCTDDEYLLNKYTCGICTDQIPNGEIISLKCNPSKHIFCYDCISDWYKEIKPKKHSGNYSTINICPICRKNGGFLPCIKNDTFIKGIHIFNNSGSSNNNNNNEIHICNAKLKTKEGYCTAKGNPKYGGLCGIHRIKDKPIIENSQLPQVDGSGTVFGANPNIIG